MKQNPNNLKFKKYHKPSSSFLSLNSTSRVFPINGRIALKATTAGKIRLNEIEAARRTIRRTIGRTGKLWICVFTYSSVTKKPLAARMGKGKGNHNYWVCPVRKGQILFELGFLKQDLGIRCLMKASSKLSIRTKIIKVTY